MKIFLLPWLNYFSMVYLLDYLRCLENTRLLHPLPNSERSKTERRRKETCLTAYKTLVAPTETRQAFIVLRISSSVFGFIIRYRFGN
jgi:hypothetical protein